MTRALFGELKANVGSGSSMRRRAHLTFRGNVKTGRHGWLRLTPAYSLHVVNQILGETKRGERILDPFSGTGTTALASATFGIPADAVDINPFLVWLGNLKLHRFAHGTGEDLEKTAQHISGGLKRRRVRELGWTPQIHQIEKWWDPETLAALSHLYSAITACTEGDDIRDLLKIAFGKAMIGTSNASFSHQSMSFKAKRPIDDSQGKLFDDADLLTPRDKVFLQFNEAVAEIRETIASDVPAADGNVFLGDSRGLEAALPKESKYTKVITSPPYPNRMSYIRELRPYMYWFGFLENGRQAGEMDWAAIGGTWGCATSNLSNWKPANGPIAYPRFDEIVRSISKDHELLGRYVHKYFDDIKLHLQSLRKVLAPGAQCFYIVGNSKFYETLLPVEEIYAALFEDAGFRGARWEVIRKRNSKKELFEYVVYAEAP